MLKIIIIKTTLKVLVSLKVLVLNDVPIFGLFYKGLTTPYFNFHLVCQKMTK